MAFTNQFSTIPTSEIKIQIGKIAYPFLDFLFKTDNASVTACMKTKAIFPAHIWRTYVKANFGYRDPDHVTDLLNHAINERYYEPLSVREANELLQLNTRGSGSYIRVRPEHLRSYLQAYSEKLPKMLFLAPAASNLPDASTRDSASVDAFSALAAGENAS